MVENLQANRLKLQDLPWVLQYNKRDLINALSFEVMEKTLNEQFHVPSFESVALDGRGVFGTLKGITRLAFDSALPEPAASSVKQPYLLAHQESVQAPL
jgi:signal recognition particle receptor subunit beta